MSLSHSFFPSKTLLLFVWASCSLEGRLICLRQNKLPFAHAPTDTHKHVSITLEDNVMTSIHWLKTHRSTIIALQTVSIPLTRPPVWMWIICLWSLQWLSVWLHTRAHTHASQSVSLSRENIDSRMLAAVWQAACTEHLLFAHARTHANTHTHTHTHYVKDFLFVFCPLRCLKLGCFSWQVFNFSAFKIL